MFIIAKVIALVVVSNLAITPLDTLWTRTYGSLADESAYHLVEAPDGGFVLVGYTKNTIGGDMNIYIVKTDAFGELEWEKNIGQSDTSNWKLHDKANYIIIDSFGDYVLTGIDLSHSFYRYCYILKLKPNGDTLWWKTYGPEYGGGGRYVLQTSDGGYIVTGTTRSPDLAPNLNGDIFLLKTDTDGNEEWLKTYDFGDLSEYGYGTIELAGVGYYVYGALSFTHKAFLMLVDYEGKFIWIKNYQGSDPILNTTWFFSHLIYKDGILFTGMILEMVGLFVYTDMDGNVRWWKEYFKNNLRSYATNTVFSKDGNFTSALNSYDSLTVFKMNFNGDSLWSKKYRCDQTDSMMGCNTIINTKDRGYAICGYKGSKENADMYLMRFAPDTVVNSINVSLKPDFTYTISEGYLFLTIMNDRLAGKELSLFDIAGRKVAYRNLPQHMSSEKVKLDIRDLSSGVYFLKIGKNDSAMRKVVLVR